MLQLLGRLNMIRRRIGIWVLVLIMAAVTLLSACTKEDPGNEPATPAPTAVVPLNR